MKILVTGANGQLGKELQRVLEGTCPGISVYTDVENLDITNADEVKAFVQRGDFTHIVNCAAYTAVDKAESEPALCNLINADAVKNLAMAAADSGVKVLHISTDYVFDGKTNRPYRESDRVNPLSTYGTSKRKGEMVLLSMCPDSVIVRTAWLYSPHGHNFVKTMVKLGREKENLGVVFDQIGTPTSASDLAEAIKTILLARQWIPGIYHFTNEGACSWYDFAKAIHRIAGITTCNLVPLLTEDYPTAATSPTYSLFDKSLIKKTYNISIPYWEESLAKCMARMVAEEA